MQRGFAVTLRPTLVAMEIGVEMCLAGRELTEPTLSPDGRTVAFAACWGSSVAIVTVPVGGGPERIVTTSPAPTPGRGFGGGCFAWLPDAAGLVYAASDGNIWLQPVPGGVAHPISAVADGTRLEAPAVASDGRSLVAVRDQAEVWQFAITADVNDTGTRIDDGSADFVFDPVAVRLDGTGGWVWTAWNVPDMPWDSSRAELVHHGGGTLQTITPPAAIQQIRQHPDGRLLSVRDDTGWSNIWLGDRPLVDETVEHAGPTWGMGQRSYAVSPDGSRVAFTRNERGFGRLCVADAATGVVTEIARGVHGQLGWSGDRLVALRSGARTPTQVVAYDTITWDRTVLAIGPVAGWESAALPEPELVEVDHDGVTLHARRYVAGEGRTLCWVHGGPTAQWQVEFMPRIAYWWAAGWDVLVPDPRGSTGHGRAYQQALRNEWGVLDVADTAAILAGSHRRGWSSPSRTVMMGGSSGGLTALGVLGRHPGLAAGGVVLYPVVDLESLAEQTHRFEAHYTVSLVGPPGDVLRHRTRSPLAYADRIDVPVLVMHGDADPVVPLASTITFAERVRAAGGEVELVVMDGEGHGFRDPVNRRAEFEHTGRFLRRVVGSRDG
jgi:dipeptidyl aminopeptidase/acylaminoacyl peptidase